MTRTPPLPSDIAATVAAALREDIGTGDITAQLIAEDALATAHIISREPAVICGVAWVNEVVRQVDPAIVISWHVSDGDAVARDQTLVTLRGSARHLLTAERCALNFLQTLSGTATLSHHYAALVKHTQVRLLDTRKTIPGLRTAQKYAVAVGGCSNHRMGLYDAFLIKENHIRACGSITAAVARARELHADKPVEVEVENLVQLREAMAANAETIMLDNFALNAMREAVIINDGKARLEASGGVNQDTLVAIAETGVDFISIGALTKDCKAIDLSMLFRNTQES
ncbi:MAG: nicotinate-nucleotide diphosphorylase (carboxylating) [Gammaproteobacteria bacterium RIFCSPLOWO2_02_FULL_57_10]|nr:MAG: nicotinate-nucleotide diphosphorylase (carboxylating) [Gammaproteobacteria bacterium RIFCSPLOWO2_02_FULL_57_10]